MAPEQPHILVVDDDRRLRELLRKYLSDNGFRVSTASNADDARGQMQTLEFDLIVLDVMMPGENGFDLTGSMRKVGNRVPVLLLTAMSEPEHRIAGLERGADDYLPKPFEPRELLLRIRTILRRVPPRLVPTEIRLGRLRFDLAREELRDGERLVKLTEAETRLLRLLAESPGQAIPREELTRRGGIAGHARTVDVHVARLRRKIESDPKLPRYLKTLRGSGYVLRPD